MKFTIERVQVKINPEPKDINHLFFIYEFIDPSEIPTGPLANIKNKASWILKDKIRILATINPMKLNFGLILARIKIGKELITVTKTNISPKITGINWDTIDILTRKPPNAICLTLINFHTS